MIDFEFISNTKMYFGKDQESKVGEIVSGYGFKNVAIVYGSERIKKTGLLDSITKQLDDKSIEYTLLGGVMPNPKLSLVIEHKKIIGENIPDMILAIGGGSVIDSAKLLSHSLYYEGNPYDFNMGVKKDDVKFVPVGVILTLSAAGSELSNSCVITNDLVSPMIKKGFNTDSNRPLFAICDPVLTETVSKFQTGCGIVDSMMHTLERFMNPNDECLLSENIAIGILKTIMHYGKIAIDDPFNYDARANLMLASSLSHNGLTSLGKKQSMRVHGIEHVVSGFYDNIAHGEGLAVLWPAYCYAIMDEPRAEKQLKILAKELFGKESAKEGIDSLKEFFESIGMKTKFSKDLDFEGMALYYSGNKTKAISDFKPIDYELVKKIFDLSV